MFILLVLLQILGQVGLVSTQVAGVRRVLVYYLPVLLQIFCPVGIVSTLVTSAFFVIKLSDVRHSSICLVSFMHPALGVVKTCNVFTSNIALVTF